MCNAFCILQAAAKRFLSINYLVLGTNQIYLSHGNMLSIVMVHVSLTARLREFNLSGSDKYDIT